MHYVIFFKRPFEVKTWTSCVQCTVYWMFSWKHGKESLSPVGFLFALFLLFISFFFVMDMGEKHYMTCDICQNDSPPKQLLRLSLDFFSQKYENICEVYYI